MPLDEGTLSLVVVALAAAVVLLVVWVAWLQRSEAGSSADERALAIVNPIAGKGAGERLAKRMAADFRAQGVRVDIVRTPAPDEAARLAREAAADGYRFIVSAGGDGTANEIANG